jgi:hypothetical protein
MNTPPTTPKTSRKSRNSRKSHNSPRTPTLRTPTLRTPTLRTPTPHTPTGNISGAVASDKFPETTEVLPSLAANPEKCDWWSSFAIKITNLINLLENYKDLFNYVITGSSAVALLAYFTNIDALSTLAAPNDGDIIIIPIDLPKRSFRTISTIGLFNIGNYVIGTNQKEEKSATFDKLEITKNTTTFDSIDVNIEDNIGYIKLDDNIKILIPKILLKRYNENFRKEKNNSKKKTFLSSRNSSTKKVFIFKSGNKNTRNNRQSRLSNFGNGTRTVLHF